MKISSYISPNVFARPVANPAATVASPAATPVVSPPLAPRDEAVFWLTAAAEIEHFLMVHYLFASYSLDEGRGGDAADKVRMLKDILRQIAREEMGHLITVQNLLTLLGAPLHLGREHSPHASEIYPFRFALERVSLDSLAKYAIAESPVDRAALDVGLTADELRLYDTELEPRARKSNDGHMVRHVGPLFARLRELFAHDLRDEDFRLDRVSRQARWDDWGYRPHPFPVKDIDLRVLVHTFDQVDSADARRAAVSAIQEIGDQGEEADVDMGDGESHFERFIAAYKLLAEIEQETGTVPVWPVVSDPNVTVAVSSGQGAGDAPDGRITASRTRAWAQLFNLRYRLLLRFLAHALRSEGPVFVREGGQSGDRTPKGLLAYWTFKEMRRLKKIAGKLVQMPLNDAGGETRAGPPFELPYRLDLPPDDTDCWRGHADVFRATENLARELTSTDEDRDDPFLAFLVEDDAGSIAMADLLGSGGSLPASGAAYEFRKVAEILDEAVRGFSVGPPHQAFWRDTDLQQFLASSVNPVKAGDPDGSAIIQRIGLPEENLQRMPRYRPRIAQVRIDYIRNWISRGAPDSQPPGMIGVVSEPEPLPEN
ncbi:ferritin-like domain-containing protein [Stappia sp. MMSF_3263]|uniref:ferritin-like domain-containing protein n=1 Tax=Stappia sp. MMSF_3263 TaxID=3046693 RepID=UPI00273F1964|nr:ferritin-like domain-containing protein [Stappia sp. MMSF_3263]